MWQEVLQGGFDSPLSEAAKVKPWLQWDPQDGVIARTMGCPPMTAEFMEWRWLKEIGVCYRQQTQRIKINLPSK